MAASNTEREPVELEFDLWGRKLRGKHWPASGTPTIGLHGRLDNANTFDELARACPDLNLFALDLAGHGLSDHRGPDVGYLGLLYIQDVIKVIADQGWEKFNILAHSMGTEVAIGLVGYFPERIEKIFCIDGFAQSERAQIRLDRERELLELMATRTIGRPRFFPDFDTMVNEVARLSDMRVDVTRVLLERGAAKTPEGYTWTSDSRVRWGFSFNNSAERVAQTFEAFNGSCFIVKARIEIDWPRDTMIQTAQRFDHVEMITLDGDHHLHIGPTSGPVAEKVRSFFAEH